MDLTGPEFEGLPLYNGEQRADVDRLRQDLLYRLRWDIFGPLDDIHVVEEPGNPNTALTPLLSHPMAHESLAHPLLATVSVYISCCEEKSALDENDEEWRYQPPAPIIISHGDGSAITVGEFVTRTHAYLNTNREQIFKCEDELYFKPEDVGDAGDGMKFVGSGGNMDEGGDGEHFWRGGNIPASARFCFEDAMINEMDTDEFQILVSVFVEGYYGKTLNSHWHHMDSAAAQVSQGVHSR
jgi:hypothetical protein